MDNKLDRAWWMLRIGLGVGPILAGLDKFFNLLTKWQMYLNPLASKLLHIRPATFMHVVGVVEIVVGIRGSQSILALRRIRRDGVAMLHRVEPHQPGSISGYRCSRHRNFSGSLHPGRTVRSQGDRSRESDRPNSGIARRSAA